MNFIPEQPKIVENVPYFDDVTERDGWRGMATEKSIETLKSEISEAICRLGGMVTSFPRGTFVIGEHNRDGFQLRYFLESPSGESIPGRIDVAALPVRETVRSRKTTSKRKEQALKMALFNVRDAIDGLRRLQLLSPGYAALMPFMLAPGSEKTISQYWMESNLLSSGEDSEIVNGEFKRI
jgi:hypothetical protein